MKVWLDDERPMPLRFTHHVKNVDEAKTLLLTGQVEIISLDFVLGSVGYPTGGDLTDWIVEQAKLNTFPPPKFYFHSSSPNCNNLMKDDIREALKHWEKHNEKESKAEGSS